MKRFLTAPLILKGLLVVTASGLLQTASAVDPPLYWDATDGTPVRQGYHIEWQRSAENGDTGELIISWSDTRFGLRDLFAQKVDASQPASPKQWSDTHNGEDVDCLIVNADVIRQEDPVLITDEAGGAIISWIDFRDDLAGDIYVNRIVDGGNGTGALAWDPDGVLLCDECANGSENMSKSQCIDGEGGSWIVWGDRRASTWDLYISHVDIDGNIDSNFGVNGRAVCNEVGDQRTVSMEHDGNGGAFLVWVDKRDAADDNLYIEHVLADGTFVNNNNGLVVTDAPGRQYSAKVTWDGDDGAFVAWVDLSSDNAGDVYVQHYSSSLTPTFAQGGIAVAAQQNNAEKNPRITPAGDGTTLLMWEDNRNDPGNTQADIYVQKMSTSDLEVWGEGGVPATLASGNQDQARLASDGAGGAFIVWEDYRNESYSAVFAQKLTTAGARLWGDNGVFVVDHGSDAIAPALRPDGEGGLFVAWGDLIRGSLGIFTQHLNSSGAHSFDTNGDDSAWGISGSCSSVKNIGNDDGVLVFWVDPRNADGPHVYMQNLARETGAPALEPNGVPVDLSLTGGQFSYQVLDDGDGGAFVLIEAGTDRAQQAFLTRVDGSGNMVWDESKPVTPGFDIDSGLEYQERVRIAISGDHVVVGWSGVDTDYSDFYAEVGAQAFDFDGNHLWGDDGLRITATADEIPDINEKFDAVVADGNGGAWILWDSGNWADTDILMQYVNAAGEIQYSADGVAFASGDGKQEAVRAVPRTGGGLIGVWLDYTAEDSNSDLIARAYDASGNLLWNTPVDMRTGSQKTPMILSDRHGGAFVLYTDFSNAVDDDAYQRHLLADGTLEWNDANGEIYVAAGTQEDVTGAVVPREGWNGLVSMLSAEESGDTTGYKDLFAQDSHVGPMGGAIDHENYSGTFAEYYHTQREPAVSYDQADGVYASWIDMRASGKEDIKDIYTTRIDDVDTNVDLPQEPRAFHLAQNYPNPFNPETIIDFQIVTPGQVNLAVYNLSGQLVSTLVDGELASGTHQVRFDASALASGVYVYRLTSNNMSQAKKMVLVR